ncbi:hypothetical protein GCM10027053_33400 [Intrasporangium mesophilum]
MAAQGAAGVPTAEPPVPLDVRIGFAHAVVQWVANDCRVDVLHVKGAALDAELVGQRGYSDADVLVRPAHVRPLLNELQRHGWVLINTFAYGSSFEHSATLRHELFGLLDLHRLFPGTGPTPDLAFAELWADRAEARLGGVRCTVPSRSAHALLLLLHAARAREHDGRAARDVERVWTTADEGLRSEILGWVDRLDAGLAFSVITGRLDEHSDDPAYDLWRVAARGGTRLDEWRARMRAARGFRAKASVVGRSVLVNVEHLTIVRGRPVTKREVVAEFFDRPVRGVREQVARRRAQRGGGRG